MNGHLLRAYDMLGSILCVFYVSCHVCLCQSLMVSFTIIPILEMPSDTKMFSNFSQALTPKELRGLAS